MDYKTPTNGHEGNSMILASYDLFDTLLLRNVDSIDKVFDKFLTPQQKKVRLDTEHALREVMYKSYGLDDIKLEEIWKYCVQQHYFKYEPDWERWMLREINAERSIIYANPDFAFTGEDNVHQLFVTDMYIPNWFVVELLERVIGVDVNGYCHIYISGELGLSKATGRIWEYIGEDIQRWSDGQFELEDVFHIGDNYHSDVLIPRNYGVKTYHYRGQ